MLAGSEIMSFDARIPRLIKTNLPLVRRDWSCATACRRGSGFSRCGSPTRTIAVEAAALGKPLVERAAAHPCL